MNTKPGASAQQQTSNPGTAPNRDEVQERAYYRYVERGRTDGKALDDWLSAETEARQNARGRAES
jgi:hypothetical protein